LSLIHFASICEVTRFYMQVVGKFSYFNLIRQVAKRIANVRFDFRACLL
jgi:hypothetical protein